MPLIFYIKKCKKLVQEKWTDIALVFFANSSWEILLKAIRQQLGTAKKRYRKPAAKCPKLTG
jgi:hypothetical protein